MKKAAGIFLICLILVSCGSSVAPKPDDSKSPETAIAKKPDSGKAVPSDKEARAEKLLAERTDEGSLLRQRNRAFAENYFKLGKQQYEKVQIEVAKENLKLALRYNPEHRRAAELLEKVQAMLGERPSKVETFFKWSVKERKIKIQQRKHEIHNLLRKGQELYDQEEYIKAKEVFEEALIRIKTMPYDVDMSAEKKKAQAGCDKSKR